MDKTLLISANKVREITPISDNINEKELVAAIKEAQNVSLRNVIGSNLLNRLKELIDNDLIYSDDYCDYVDLLDEMQYYLAYTAVVKLIPQIQWKVDNAGIFTTDDEHLKSLDVKDTITVVGYYQSRADYYCMLLQKYLMRNKDNFPELDACSCKDIDAHLNTAFTSGLFLGARRGVIKNKCRK